MIEKTQQRGAAAEFGSPLEAYVRLMFTQMLAAMARTLRNDNLTLPQLAALHLVAARGQMRIGALATELLLPMPAASRMISDMVERGLLLRQEDETDRRAKTVRVSPDGYELIELISHQRAVEASAAVIDEAVGPVHERYMLMFADIVRSGLDKAPRKDPPEK